MPVARISWLRSAVVGPVDLGSAAIASGSRLRAVPWAQPV